MLPIPLFSHHTLMPSPVRLGALPSSFLCLLLSSVFFFPLSSSFLYLLLSSVFFFPLSSSFLCLLFSISFLSCYQERSGDAAGANTVITEALKWCASLPDSATGTQVSNVAADKQQIEVF